MCKIIPKSVADSLIGLQRHINLWLAINTCDTHVQPHHTTHTHTHTHRDGQDATEMTSIMEQ